LLFLIASLPAAQIYQWGAARGAVPGELYQISGSVWRGRAATLRYAGVSLNGITWSFRPTALVLGRIEYAITATLGSGGDLATIAGRSLNGAVYARDARLSAPVNELATLTG